MPADLDDILKLDVPLIVAISSHEMTMEEVLDLTPGSILELPKESDEELQILVSDKPIGLGRAVKVGENFGIKVTFIGDIRERIEALGSATLPTSSESGEEADADSMADELLAGQ